MYRFIWNTIGVVGLCFLTVIITNPALVPGTVAATKVYYRTINNFAQLLIEEWNKSD